MKWSDLKTGFVCFSRTKKFSYLMIFLSGFLYTIGFQIFLAQADVFSNGIGSIAILLTFISDYLSAYFSIFYFLLNLPLILIFWKRVKKSFISRTMFFLVVQLLLGSVFLFPEVNVKLDEYFSTSKDNDWFVFFFAVVAAFFVGVSVGVSWKYGGSCGGTDIVAYYYSTKKKKAVSKILFFISILLAVFSIVVSLTFLQEQRENTFPRVFATLVFIAISSFLVELIYPKYSKIEIEIHSEKLTQILEHFAKTQFQHPIQVQTFYSVYQKKDKKLIKTVVLLLEIKPLVKKLKQIDPKIWISTKKVLSVYGNFSTKSVD